MGALEVDFEDLDANSTTENLHIRNIWKVCSIVYCILLNEDLIARRLKYEPFPNASMGSD